MWMFAALLVLAPACFRCRRSSAWAPANRPGGSAFWSCSHRDVAHRLFHPRAALADPVARHPVRLRPVGVPLPQDRHRLHARPWTKGPRSTCRSPCRGPASPQAADDLKARDALLRGFPEVESVIGKAGRADTPTDPAPLDMVETFVNFRPKEFWPKRVLRYTDAAAQTNRVMSRLESDGFVKAAPRRTIAVNWSMTQAKRHSSDSMRRCVVYRSRCTATPQRELGPELVRFTIKRLIDNMRAAGHLHWPAGMNEQTEIDKLTATLSPKYDVWLAAAPSQEDITQLCQDVGKQLAQIGAINDVVESLELKPSAMGDLVSGAAEFFGATHHSLSSTLLAAVQQERDRFWHERVGKINWELFDRGTETFTWYALEELTKAAQGFFPVGRIQSRRGNRTLRRSGLEIAT